MTKIASRGSCLKHCNTFSLFSSPSFIRFLNVSYTRGRLGPGKNCLKQSLLAPYILLFGVNGSNRMASSCGISTGTNHSCLSALAKQLFTFLFFLFFFFVFFPWTWRFRELKAVELLVGLLTNQPEEVSSCGRMGLVWQMWVGVAARGMCWCGMPASPFGHGTGAVIGLGSEGMVHIGGAGPELEGEKWGGQGKVS